MVPGKHRAAAALPLPGKLGDLEFNRMHLAVAGAVSLVLAVGLSIVLGNLPGDGGGYGAGGEEAAALLYVDGEALPADFAERHPALVERIHAELETRYGLTADQLYDEAERPDGYRVVLTLDRALQEAAEETSGEAGVVAVEPGTGAVRCYYGAEEATGADQVGAATPHPPSSVFDMITAATALENGASLESWWSDEDADVTLTEAVRESRSGAIDQVAEKYGAEAVLATAASLGLTAISDEGGNLRDLTSEPDYEGLQATDLGSYPVSVIDMATVYATIANGGVRADTHLIERVVDGSTSTVEPEQDIRTDQAVVETTAQDLQFVGLGNSAAIEDRDFFALGADFHGTTTQSWFVGAIPQLSVAAWANGEAAADGGIPLWRNVIDTAIEVHGYAAEKLPGASGVGDDLTDGITDDNGSIDPDSEYCKANPDVEGCAATESPSAEPTTEEPEPDPTTEAPEPDPDPTTEEPDPTTEAPVPDPSTNCGLFGC